MLGLVLAKARFVAPGPHALPTIFRTTAPADQESGEVAFHPVRGRREDTTINIWPVGAEANAKRQISPRTGAYDDHP